MQQAATTTSEMGIAKLERDEGVVLRAYRCPAGVWTIGAGLTRASGVVDPKPGMVITREEARRLLRLARAANYEPTVRDVMVSPLGAANQWEFDGALSFHFNTGALKRASWVEAWRRRDWSQVMHRLARWNKGGGQVLPGLVRRRAEEYELMHFGRYGGTTAPHPEEGAAYAR